MKNKYSRFVVVLLAGVFVISVSASFDAHRVEVLKGASTTHEMIPGQKVLARLVRQAVGAYVVARFVTGLGNQHLEGATAPDKIKTPEITNTARCSGPSHVFVAN
jgi:hypothetical protein